MLPGTTIQSVEIYKLSIPLKEPFVISLGPIYEAQNVVVIIRTRNGCTGYGECSPYMTINGESVDTCFIVGQYFAKVLKGKDALDIVGCINTMDKTIYANTSIKSAFDIALHDIAAQQAGVPLYRLLGGNKDKVLETDMTVSIGDPQKMKSEASPIPIMADESCGDEHDAERLIQLKACRMFNIKLGKSSGFYKGVKIAELGAKANMSMQVGGFMESRLGMTAAAHLALSND